MARYTNEWVSANRFNYNELSKIRTLSELPENTEARLREELHENAGMRYNTGTQVIFVSNDGHKVFRAYRHSDRYTGYSYWSVGYGKRVWSLKREPMCGYDWKVWEKGFTATADGTSIPKRVERKADVIELMKHITWCNEALIEMGIIK